MKNIMEGMNNRLLQVEETINQMENREQENHKADKQKEKGILRNERLLSAV